MKEKRISKLVVWLLVNLSVTCGNVYMWIWLVKRRQEGTLFAMESSELATRICLLGDAINDSRLLRDVKKFNVPTIFATAGFCFNDSKIETVFLMKRFKGSMFNELKREKSYLLGPTAIRELVMLNQPLLKRPRPTYCLSMKGLSICLSGFTDKDDADNLMSMIKYMCGSVYKECDKMSHLVSQTCLSEKYRYAVVYEKPIMSKEWVITCWERRHEVGFRADSIDMLSFKMKVLSGLYISFKNFSTEETKDMEIILKSSGGIVVELIDTRCTHVVINEYDYKPEDLDLLPKKAFWMKCVWFWKSIQFNIKIVEDDYLINVDNSAEMELLNDGFCAQEVKCLNSTNYTRDSGVCTEESCNKTFPIFSSEYKQTERRNVSIELHLTEFGYVKLLNTLQEIDDYCFNCGNEMLRNSERIVIFGSFYSIKKLHSNLLWDLKALCVHWKEECEIGKVLQKFCGGILDAYTQFIENFENIDQTLVRCSKLRPRFYAYLQLRKLESKKQHLKDMIIRPVQRLPSMVLLIKELIEKTDKHTADYGDLILAKTQLENSIKELNSRKGKFDNYYKQFQIFNAISNSPSTVLSSTRQYILSFGAIQIEGDVGKHGDTRFIFLFSDILQVCKLNKRLHPFDDCKTAETLMKYHAIPFKHLQLITITDIKMLIEVEDKNDTKNHIVIVEEVETVSDYKRYVFQLFEDTNKSLLLDQLHKYLSLNYTRNDFVIEKQKAVLSGNK